MNSTAFRLVGGALAAVLAAATLAGCAAGASDPSEADGPIVLRYWSWAPNIGKIVDVWNETHPDVQVEVNTSVGAADIVAKLAAAKEAGSLPHASNTTYENLPNLIVNGIASDITEAFGEYEDKIAPAAWNLTTFDDKNYAVPQGTGPQFLFYRVDIFESLGLEAPTTWDEYAEAARTIHAADPSKYLATFPANDAQLFAALSAQAGAEWWSQEGASWSVGIDSEPSQKVADYWQGLVDEGVVTTLKTWTPEWQAALADGTLASWLSAVWAPPLILQNAPDTEGKWAAVQIPQWKEGDSVSAALGGSATVVTTGSKHAKEAQEFAIWLNNSEQALTAYIENASIWPANLAGRELPGLKDTIPAALVPSQTDYWDVAAKTDEEAVPVTWGPNVATAYSTFGDAFGTAISSGGSFSDALTTVQKAVVADMEKLGFQVD